jgi:hypothetical protein
MVDRTDIKIKKGKDENTCKPVGGDLSACIAVMSWIMENSFLGLKGPYIEEA